MKATLGKLKGKDLRPTQVTAIEFVRNSKRRFVAVRGPTGVGKTALAFEGSHPPFFYLCNSISLQEQAVRDYPEAALLMGRGNYECEKFGTADLCLQQRPCNGCAYEEAKHEGLANSMTILNFHYFLSLANFTKSLEGVNRNIIVDEADSMEQVLADFISFDLTLSKLDSMVGKSIPPPDRKTKLESVLVWMSVRLQEVNREMNSMWGHIKGIMARSKQRALTIPEQKVIKKYNALKSLKWKLDFLTQEDLSNNWTYRFDDVRGHVQLKPIWLTRALADRFFFRHGMKFLFMSATIPSK